MGNKFKCCGKQENSEQFSQTTKVCLCKRQYDKPEQYDNSFPYNDLPPPAPPNGRDDLWELQFCRWWGWNWVRRREAEETPNTKGGEPKHTRFCRGKELERKNLPPLQESGQVKRRCCRPSPAQMHSEPMKIDASSTEPIVMRQARPLPTKKEFREMCKCLLGKKRNTNCGMANLYNTPSASMVAMERLSCGMTDKTVMRGEQFPKCIGQNCPKKTRQESIREDGCRVQSWSKDLDQEPETLSEEINSEPLGPQKNYSSTEESIEYLSVRLQHIASDMCCPCRGHHGPEQKQEKSVDAVKDHLEAQTSFSAPQDHKETQTIIEQAKPYWPPKQGSPCGEKLLKLKGKKHRTICICVCCCGTCKSSNTGENVKYIESFPDQQPHKDLGASKSAKCDKCSLGGKDLSPNLSNDHPVTYPVIVPPVMMKTLSKFGTPSKDYPWMHSVQSDGTTTTLNNIETYKSPASGKTYDFTTFNVDTRVGHENYTLPELIDITEDLSYLKKLEKVTEKSDHESRLLLDAVCDAILHEHEDKSFDYLNDCYVKNGVNTKGLRRDYKDLEILCDLQKEFRSRSDVHELSKTLLNENADVGVQLSSTSNMGNTANNNSSSIKFDDIDSIVRIVESICTDSNMNFPKDTVPEANNAGFSKVDNETKNSKAKNSETFKFQGDDDVFTKTGLLPCRRSNFFKKPTKRGPPSSSAKEQNSSKKLRQADNSNKIKNRDSRCPGQINDKVGTIFTKIEDIVKQSKVKSAEIQKVVKQELSQRLSDNFLKAHLLGKHCSAQKLDTRGVMEREAISSKRMYKMSSDAFKRDPLSSKNSENKLTKKRYDIFSEKFDYSLNGSEIIVEEEKGSSGRGNVRIETMSHENDDADTISLRKSSKLSVQSFIVCDQKSTASVIQKPSTGGGGMRADKKIVKKKKLIGGRGSLIPIRKQSSSGGNLSKV